MADKTAEVKPKARAKKTRRVTRQMTDALAQLVGIPLQVLSPADALTDNERIALSIALCDAAASNDIINTIIVNLTSVGGVGELVAVTAAIAGKRIVAHRMNPAAPDMRLVGILMASDVIIQGVVQHDETGTAHPARGEYGVGQNDAGTENPVDAPVQHSDTDQAGYDDLATSVADGEDGGQNPTERRKARVVRSKARAE